MARHRLPLLSLPTSTSPSHTQVSSLARTPVMQRTMAPTLAKSTLVFIRDMISSGEITTFQMAEAACCSKRTIIRIRSNLRLFGSVKAPPIKTGRPQSVTPIMLEALGDHLLEPDLYLHEMELFFLDEFDISVPMSTISEVSHRRGWSKKRARQKAKESNPDLCNDYCHLISEFSVRSCHMQ